MVQVHRRQPWTLSIRAKIKGFDFSLEASKILPVSKFFPFTIQFKHHPYYRFKIKSKPESICSWKPKFLRFFKIFRIKRSQNNSILKRGSVDLKNYSNGRRKSYILWMWALLFAMVGCFIIGQLRNYFVSKYSYKAWKYAASSGLLYHFFEVIVSGLSRFMGIQF